MLYVSGRKDESALNSSRTCLKLELDRRQELITLQVGKPFIQRGCHPRSE